MPKKTDDLTSPKIKKNKRMAKSQMSSGTDGKFRQPTMLDMLKKAGGVKSQELPNDDSASPSESAEQHLCDNNETEHVEVSAAAETLALQRFKFRQLHLRCYSILTFSEVDLSLPNF